MRRLFKGHNKFDIKFKGDETKYMWILSSWPSPSSVGILLGPGSLRI